MMTMPQFLPPPERAADPASVENCPDCTDSRPCTPHLVAYCTREQGEKK